MSIISPPPASSNFITSLLVADDSTLTKPHQLWVRTVTIITDLLLINLAFVLAYIARYQWQWLREVEPQFHIPYMQYAGQQLLLTIIFIVAFIQARVWLRKRGEFLINEVSRILSATAMGYIFIMAYTFYFRPTAVSRLMLFWAALFTIGFLTIARMLRRSLLAAAYRRGLADKVLVIGSSEAGRGVIRTLMARPDLGYKTIGYLDDGVSKHLGSGRVPHLGTWTRLQQTLENNPELHSVFIALPTKQQQHITELVNICRQYNVRAEVVPDLFQMSFNQVEMSNMAGLPVLAMRQNRINHIGKFIKRIIDISVILTLSIPTLLVSGLVALAVKLDSKGPIFFIQERVGKGGKMFKMYKFRSMVVDAEEQKEALAQMNEQEGPIFKIKDDPRLTRVGRVIRRLSLDELPQLWNVIRGEMSLVGPRPPVPKEVAEYDPWHQRRLAVTGGLTGLWQVSGRSDLTFDEQCLLDIYYIENWSLGYDIRIMFQTIPYALFGRGAY